MNLLVKIRDFSKKEFTIIKLEEKTDKIFTFKKYLLILFLKKY